MFAGFLCRSWPLIANRNRSTLLPQLFENQSKERAHDMMQQQKQEFSATAALEKSLTCQTKHVVSQGKPMIKAAALKRSRKNFDESSSSVSSFDMSEFADASKQVEESIAFPSIQWDFNDEDQDDEDHYTPTSSKRLCQGFSRSTACLDLSSLSASCQRRGSNGSLF